VQTVVKPSVYVDLDILRKDPRRTGSAIGYLSQDERKRKERAYIVVFSSRYHRYISHFSVLLLTVVLIVAHNIREVVGGGEEGRGWK